MATRHDQKLIDMLLKRGIRWNKRLMKFEDVAAESLRGVLQKFETEKRMMILAFLDKLETAEGGVLMSSDANIAELAKALKRIDALGADYWSKSGAGGKWVTEQYGKAAKLGVIKAKDALSIGEGEKITASLSPPAKEMVKGVGKMTLAQMTNRNTVDLGIIREQFMRHVYDPSSRIEDLRKALVDSGQVEGMLDSIGRRVTADERADRIAKYELAKLSQDVEQQTVNDIYNDGNPDDENTFYLWKAVGDNRTANDSRRRDGQVLSVKEWKRHDFGDRYRGLKPLRPRDRCSNIMVRPEWFGKAVQEKYFNAESIPLGEDILS